MYGAHFDDLYFADSELNVQDGNPRSAHALHDLINLLIGCMHAFVVYVQWEEYDLVLCVSTFYKQGSSSSSTYPTGDFTSVQHSVYIWAHQEMSLRTPTMPYLYQLTAMYEQSIICNYTSSNIVNWPRHRAIVNAEHAFDLYPECIVVCMCTWKLHCIKSYIHIQLSCQIIKYSKVMNLCVHEIFIYVNDVSQAHAGSINLHCINSYHAIYVITHRTHNLSRGQLILTNLH